MTEIFNHLLLPETFAERIRCGGAWATPNAERIQTAFGEPPSQAVFYTLEQMLMENEHWASETHEVYFGQADSQNPPGDVDPRKSLIIGDLGMDMPIALDYRNTPTPTVIFLGRRVLNRWITVAPSVTDPISKLSRP